MKKREAKFRVKKSLLRGFCFVSLSLFLQNYWSHYLRVLKILTLAGFNLKLSLSGDKLYEKRKAAALEVEVRARNAIINNNTS